MTRLAAAERGEQGDAAPGQLHPAEQDPAAPCGAACGGQRQEGSSHVRAAHAQCFNGIFQNTFCPSNGKGSSPAASEGWGERVQAT